MANDPYRGGAADVQPDTRAPDDYQRIQAEPAAFGAAVGTGLEKAGKDVGTVADSWGHIQANDASNNAQKEAQDLMLSIKNLEGQDALNAQDSSKQQLQAIYDKYAGQMKTTQQQEIFASQNRPFFDRYITGEMNAHFSQQGKKFADSTSDAAFSNAHEMAATAGASGNWSTVAVSREKAMESRVQALQHHGAVNSDTLAKARTDADSVWLTAVEARAATHPEEAYNWLQDPKNQAKIPPDKLAELQGKLKTASEDARSTALFTKASADAKSGASPGPYGTIPANYGPVFTQYNRMLQSGDVQGALKLSEGTRTTPYWDKSPGNPELSHWAIGMGMHQIQRADGTWEEVTPFTRITQADAERNLAVQTQKMSGVAQTAVGPAWEGLSVGARSALTSVAYNYGHIPSDIAKAGASGDPNALANAIAAHAGDNEGVNARRRLAEAGAVMGRFGLMGVEAVPRSTSEAPSEQAPPTAPTEPVENAGFVQPAPQAPQPPSIPMTELEQADHHYAGTLQNIEASDATDDVKKRAVEKATSDYRIAAAAAEMSAKAIKDKEEAASNDVLGDAMKGDFTGAYKKIAAYPDSVLPARTKLDLERIVESRSGEPNPIGYGSKWTEVLHNIVKPDDETQRISDPREIQRMEVDGFLTSKGADRAYKELDIAKKGAKGLGQQQREAGMLRYAKDYLDKSVEFPGGGGIKDTEGMHIYDTDFLNQFYGGLDTWVDAGNNAADYKLFDRKKMDEFLQELRPRSKIAQFQVGAGAQSQPPEPPGTPLPPPPDDLKIDPQVWTASVSKVPLQGGQPIRHDVWGNALASLVRSPTPETMRLFDYYYGPAGYKAADILSQLRGDKAAPATEPASQAPAGPALSEQTPGAAENTRQIGEAVSGAAKTIAKPFAPPDYKNMTPEERKRYLGL